MSTPTTVSCTRRWLPASAALLLGCTSSAVLAHVGGDTAAHHGFFTGALHPITGVDHLAAMMAVGMWSAMTARRVWLAPLSFAALLLAGAVVAQLGLALPAIEPMIAASLLVVGLLVATRTHLPAWAGTGLVGTFALFHGAAHGQELAGGLALAGMVLGTAVLHMAGMVLGLSLQRAPRWLPRAAGGLVALMGLSMGWSLLAA
ncbi:HupE/UreJ family protein [Macromonas nakdongensis]|uniref:HupE/UreJ family protein n=1 Tax=Macromonas nakdongensis TaxID=1843082 RepID=UPI000C3440F8|nr:HupE/UreJ family protein [Macromonas nakdongensis]